MRRWWREVDKDVVVWAIVFWSLVALSLLPIVWPSPFLYLLWGSDPGLD
ncbi:MAG TPA: hypothetical protein VK934_10565 [Fimbriimonas sp.]|nr:hypothetical protein [Fimbriimonas sp.]